MERPVEIGQAALREAVEASRLLLGPRERAIPPDDLCGRLKPFEHVVAENVRDPDAD